jgi:hypothetical protein
MVNIHLISTAFCRAAKNFIEKNFIFLLTGPVEVRITRFIDGGNVAGDRVLRSKFLKTGRCGLDREVRLRLVFESLRAVGLVRI